jgi:hypothetical protein
MSLVQIVYRSRELHPLGQEEILDILRKSQNKNLRKRISGLLIYREGQFLQLLEGPKTEVEELFQIIAQDPRHHEIVIIDRHDVDSVLMPTWAMGYFSPELHGCAVNEEFMLRESDARAISEFLPEKIGKAFLELLNTETLGK